MKNLAIVVAILILLGGVYVLQKPDSTKISPNTSTETSVDNAKKDSNSTTLSLSGKGLNKTPSYVFEMTNLTTLDLSNNSLDGALQSQIGQLQNLRTLDLSNNKFTGVPAEIGQLKKLEVLDLSNNLLTGLPNELGNLSNLKLLDLTGNNYSEADLAAIRKNLPSTTIIKTD